MAWIKFDSVRIKKLKKFSDFRRTLQWSTNEALGFLGSFWGEAIEVCESGDIAGWTPDYLCELTGLSLVPERVWDALVNNHWLDLTADGRVLIHDWPDWAGGFLQKKYSSKKGGRQKLVEIWAKHGRDYGRESSIDPIGDPKETERRPEGVPKGSIDKTRLDLTSKEEKQTQRAGARESESFSKFWNAYPKKKLMGKAEAAWKRIAPPAELVVRMLAAIEAAKRTPEWKRDDGKWIPNPETWLTGKGWEDETRGGVAPEVRRGYNVKTGGIIWSLEDAAAEIRKAVDVKNALAREVCVEVLAHVAEKYGVEQSDALVDRFFLGEVFGIGKMMEHAV